MDAILHFLDDLTWDYFFRVTIACLCGASFGLERQIRGKPFGIRTCMLICAGTALFILLGIIVGESTNADPTRVMGQVITGIGFLGAGAIMKHDGLVSGITSAATVWIIAAIGAAVGFGFFGMALATTICGLSTIIVSRLIEKSFKSLQKGFHKE